MTDYVGKLSPNFNEPPPPYSGPGNTNGYQTASAPTSGVHSTGGNVPIHTVSTGYVTTSAPGMFHSFVIGTLRSIFFIH